MIFQRRTLTIGLIVLMAGILTLIVLFVWKPGAGPAGAGEGGAAPATPAGEGAAVAPAATEAKAEEAPLAVKTVPARRGDLSLRLQSPGEAFVDKKVLLKAEVGGVVKSLPVREGARVRRGAVLMEIDDREYALNVQNAEAVRLQALSEMLLEGQFAEPDAAPDPATAARVDGARTAFQKTEAAWRDGLISQRDYEQARRAYEMAMIDSGQRKDEIRSAVKGLTQAEIALKKAEMELAKTKVRAPFDGIITDLKVSAGEHVTGGRELFTLVNIDEIKVLARVLEHEVGQMRPGQDVNLKFNAYPGKIFKGRVQAVSPIVNPEDRTCTVHVAMDNPDEAIKPGMHADVEIAAQVHHDKLMVPQAAILVRGVPGRKLVFVVEGGLAKWRYVQIGLENEEFAEILDGVAEGEPVIVEGHFTLAHDARVRIANE